MTINSFRRPLRSVYDGLFRFSSKTPVNVILSIQSKKCGFFGDTAITLNAIRFAELAGLDCVVEWGSRSLYYDPAAGPNVWEYCFSQSKFSFNRSSKQLNFSIPYYSSAFGFTPYQGLSGRKSLSLAISKFCQPHPKINELVEAYINNHFASSTLGVHYRGTDASAGFEQRNAASLEQLEMSIAKWLSSNPNGNVFLASDESLAVERLTHRFPDAIHYRNCLRSTDGVSLHGHYDNGASESGHQKSLDVLIDAMLLSKCCLLLAHGSRVAWFAMAMNPKLDMIDYIESN